MKLLHVIHAVRSQPWLITPGGWETVHALVESKLAQAEVARLVSPAAGLRDSEGGEVYEYQVIGNIAVIPIKGTLVKGASSLAKACGACSPEDIEDNLARALGDARVKAILLDINSPGGQVRGVPELAAKIAQANQIKRIYAYTDGLLCSAAYYLAAGCYAIYCTPTAEVGSIGVVLPYVDRSAEYEKAGVKIMVFKGGQFKGEGIEGTSLSPEFQAMLQSRVDRLYADFTAHARTYRRRVRDEDMQGQSFLGTDAASKGLVDGLVADIGGVFERMLAR